VKLKIVDGMCVLAAVLCVAGPAVAQQASLETRPPNGAGQTPAFTGQTRAPERKSGVTFDVVTVAEGFVNPWGMTFLPDGRFLVTERPGRLRIVSKDGKLSEPVTGLPEVDARGQGGLLGVEIDPQFKSNGLIYWSYAELRDGGVNNTAVARGKLVDGATPSVQSVQVIYHQSPSLNSQLHFGGRLIFRKDGTLFVTQGDRSITEGRMQAQNKDGLLGKIVRINADGSIPKDNPFFGKEGVRPEIWSIGHRNIQAAALHPQTGQLWTIEHGARGGDEVNIPQPGRNYGWPVITYGVDYSGARIGEGTAKAGLEQPVYYWDPSIAPSGMAFYTGDRFPAWRGSILVGALSGKLLARLETSGGKVTAEERMLQGLGERIRDVRQGPDGFVYLLTDSANGRILRVRPAG
jgi:glucose/arabinose dehydrogenase